MLKLYINYNYWQNTLPNLNDNFASTNPKKQKEQMSKMTKTKKWFNMSTEHFTIFLQF